MKPRCVFLDCKKPVRKSNKKNKTKNKELTSERSILQAKPWQASYNCRKRNFPGQVVFFHFGREKKKLGHHGWQVAIVLALDNRAWSIIIHNYNHDSDL